MKLRNIILGTLLGVFAVGATANAQVGFNVHAGYQGANVTGTNADTKIVSGARAGVAVDIPVYQSYSSKISIQPGLDFAMKGYKYEFKYEFKGNLANADSKTTLYYLDIPVLANFAFDLGNDLGVFANFGPYFGIGLGGDISNSASLGSIDINLDDDVNPFDSDKGLYRRFDCGVQIGAGVEYNRFQLGLGTQFGFVDMRQDDVKIDNDKALHNADFFVMLGYRF